MAFRRKRTQPEQESGIDALRQQLTETDPLAAEIAELTVKAWVETFPEVAQLATESDQGKTTPSQALTEAFLAASATKGAHEAGDSDAESLFGEQVAIAQSQAAVGMTKEWVVGFMQIRCLAVGSMLASLNADSAEEFRTLFWSWVDEAMD